MRSVASSIVAVCACTTLLMALASCSKGSPTESDSPPGSSAPFLGTWSGGIRSDVIGVGTATVVFDVQAGPDAYPLLSGNWSFVFGDPAFSTKGTVAANLDTRGTGLVVFFDRGAVPCPGQPGGASQQTIVATLARTGARMLGDYIAGSCPGGSMDLVKR